MISDPELVPIVFDRALYPPNANVLDRPVDQILHDIDVVRSWSCSKSAHVCQSKLLVLITCILIIALMMCLRHCAYTRKSGDLHRFNDSNIVEQVTSNAGEPNMLSAKTGDPYWRLVRKGVAPAFNPQNIR